MASTPRLDLPTIMAAAYVERHQGYRTALANFVNLASSNSDFHAQAKAEHDRLTNLEKSVGCPLAQRCYASSHQLAFLKVALSVPIPETPQEEQDMPSKLKALADAAKDAVADVEQEAGAAITRLTAAKQKAVVGVGKINNISAEIEQSAADLNDFAAQTSNFPPSDEK